MSGLEQFEFFVQVLVAIGVPSFGMIMYRIDGSIKSVSDKLDKFATQVTQNKSDISWLKGDNRPEAT